MSFQILEVKFSKKENFWTKVENQSKNISKTYIQHCYIIFYMR